MHLKPFLLAGIVWVAAAFNSPIVLAYGGGSSGSSSCAAPRFYDESPAQNSVIQSLREFSIVASENTDISTLELKVNAEKVKPEITQKRSGSWLLQVKLPEALHRAGKVRITLAAKSKEGCAAFYPFYLEIRS